MYLVIFLSSLYDREYDNMWEDLSAPNSPHKQWRECQLTGQVESPKEWGGDKTLQTLSHGGDCSEQMPPQYNLLSCLRAEVILCTLQAVLLHISVSRTLCSSMHLSFNNFHASGIVRILINPTQVTWFFLLLHVEVYMHKISSIFPNHFKIT